MKESMQNSFLTRRIQLEDCPIATVQVCGIAIKVSSGVDHQISWRIPVSCGSKAMQNGHGAGWIELEYRPDSPVASGARSPVEITRRIQRQSSDRSSSVRAAGEAVEHCVSLRVRCCGENRQHKHDCHRQHGTDRSQAQYPHTAQMS